MKAESNGKYDRILDARARSILSRTKRLIDRGLDDGVDVSNLIAAYILFRRSVVTLDKMARRDGTVRVR